MRERGRGDGGEKSQPGATRDAVGGGEVVVGGEDVVGGGEVVVGGEREVEGDGEREFEGDGEEVAARGWVREKVWSQGRDHREA